MLFHPWPGSWKSLSPRRRAPRTSALRASVGSTEASNGRLARVGRIDRGGDLC
jgi:hypothetical protein